MVDEIGIHVPLESVVKILESQSGVKIKDGVRVCISPESVTELLGPFPKKPKIT